MAKVLITGGAGFIGSHLADELIANGYEVRVMDCLDPQVHGDSGAWPGYLSRKVERSFGDISVPEQVNRALRGVDAVVHFAAAVGVGQSMYRIQHYVRTNALGTAVLLEALTQKRTSRLIVASSMSVYGEGLYETPAGESREFVSRSAARLEEGQWDPLDDGGEALVPVPTPEDKPVSFQSIYAQSKYDQEKMCLLVGEAYRIPTTALRFFNAYGPRQALSNPYTGVLAIFAARLLNGRAPVVFEDGKQRRDFVHVKDVARACRLALEADRAAGEVINVGSGRSVTVCEVAERLALSLGRRLRPEITGKFRVGDVRHCFADIRKAQAILNFKPEVSLEEGMEELTIWLAGQQASDRLGMARQELVEHGLTK